MGPTINFIFALVIATTTLAGGSLVWPRFTPNERPKLLQEVHDVVLKTSIGQESANVLGVSDEKHIQPINFGQMVYSAVNGVKDAIQNRIRTVIVGNAVNQLSSQFDHLPRDEKLQIQQALCKPVDKQGGTSSPSSSRQ